MEGVLAHEFGHYDHAQGPEGTRRTVTHYGPVVGGLPIAATHCELCGLLRLRYPDGRREERQLFPGPQPGLLARPAPIDPGAELEGHQPRVSGLSVSRELAPVFAREVAVAPRRRFLRWDVPDLGVVDWFSVAGLVATGVGLVILAILAVYDYQTPIHFETEAAIATSAIFAAVVLLQIGAAAWRHWVRDDGLAPLPGAASTAAPGLDTVTRIIVGLLCITMLAGLVAAILATYDYSTPRLMGPTVIVGVGAFAVAIIFAILRALVDHFTVDDEPGR